MISGVPKPKSKVVNFIFLTVPTGFLPKAGPHTTLDLNSQICQSMQIGIGQPSPLTLWSVRCAIRALRMPTVGTVAGEGRHARFSAGATLPTCGTTLHTLKAGFVGIERRGCIEWWQNL